MSNCDLLCSPQGEETKSLTLVLHRDAGSLGFNIIGGRPCAVGPSFPGRPGEGRAWGGRAEPLSRPSLTPAVGDFVIYVSSPHSGTLLGCLLRWHHPGTTRLVHAARIGGDVCVWGSRAAQVVGCVQVALNWSVGSAPGHRHASGMGPCCGSVSFCPLPPRPGPPPCLERRGQGPHPSG